jgi:hypothetical protein
MKLHNNHLTKARLARAPWAFFVLPLFALAGAVRAESTTSLIRRLTDESSSAGQRGDQATVDRLTDPIVLFSAGDGSVQRDERLDSVDALAARLKARTIALHGATSPRTLPFVHRSAVFINELGAADRRSDFTGGPATLDAWIAHRADDVAVTSFTLRTSAAGVRVVEVWHQQRGAWMLVAGQSIPLNPDPPTVDLSAALLGTYVGAYSAGPGSLARIDLGAAGLSFASQGGKPSPLAAMERDRFFTPGLPAGYLRPATQFKRDPSGTVTGFERNGIVYRRIDAVDTAAVPASPPAPGPLKLRDFTVRAFGNVAVATFFHDRDTPYYGQTLHQTYRSMEAWINHAGRWTMISSQGQQIIDLRANTVDDPHALERAGPKTAR